jgi:HPt (histidine-containing phosphotransfer) domain-containing protein
MTNPVDLTDLRSMTDGDRDLEISLFQEFFSSCETSINLLYANCSIGQNEIWRSSAHALKGVSLNLGAKKLGDLCKKAQDNPSASEDEKKILLEEILAEYHSGIFDRIGNRQQCSYHSNKS